MSTYKLTNTTNLAGKRDFKYNSVLDITVVEGMVKNTMKLKPGDTVYLTVASLPLSVHRLRVKGLVTVVEVSPSDVPKKAKPQKTPIKPKAKAVEKKVDEKKIPAPKKGRPKSTKTTD